MTVKTTGAQWNEFYNDPLTFPGHAGVSWHEDEYITVNGVEVDGDMDLSNVEAAAVVTIKGGVVYINDKVQPLSLETYFKEWLKSQHYLFMVVKVHRDFVDAVQSAVAAAGGKIMSPLFR